MRENSCDAKKASKQKIATSQDYLPREVSAPSTLNSNGTHVVCSLHNNNQYNTLNEKYVDKTHFEPRCSTETVGHARQRRCVADHQRASLRRHPYRWTLIFSWVNFSAGQRTRKNGLGKLNAQRVRPRENRTCSWNPWQCAHFRTIGPCKFWGIRGLTMPGGAVNAMNSAVSVTRWYTHTHTQLNGHK